MKYKFEKDSVIITSESKEMVINYDEFNNIIWMPPRRSKKGLLKLDNYSIQVKKFEIEEYLDYLKKIAISIEPKCSFQFIGKYVDKEIFWIHKNEVKSPPPEVREIISNIAKKVLKTFWIIAIITAIFYTMFGIGMLADGMATLGVFGLVLGMPYAISTAYIGIRRFMFWGRTITAPSILGCLVALLFGFLGFLLIPLFGLYYGWFGGGIYLLIKYQKLKKGQGFNQLPSHQLTEIYEETTSS